MKVLTSILLLIILCSIAHADGTVQTGPAIIINMEDQTQRSSPIMWTGQYQRYIDVEFIGSQKRKTFIVSKKVFEKFTVGDHVMVTEIGLAEMPK